MAQQFKQAMVMAAGLGSRLLPLTRDVPKPLLPIKDDGTTCLDLVLDRLHRQKMDRIIVNAYHLAGAIETFVRHRYPNVIMSREPEPLETGGGFIHALPHFERDAPVLVVSSDTYLEGDAVDQLGSDMLANFNPQTEDMLLAVSAKTNGIAFTGTGDYELTGTRLDYRPNGVSAPYVFIGHRVVMPTFMQICAERLYPEKGACFSFKDCFDIAEANGRLTGRRFDGIWCDLSTVDTLNALRAHKLRLPHLVYSPSPDLIR